MQSQQTDFSKLPPPPSGQTGVTFSSLQHLPPPPQGQTGMTFDQISQQPKQTPLASDQSGNFFTNVATSLKDEMVGGAKSLVGGAVNVASSLQGMGQRLMTGFGGQATTPGYNAPTTPNPAFDQRLQGIQQNTGFKSLDSSTPEGQGVQDILQPKNTGEQVGKVLGDVGQFASGFKGGGAEDIIAKGKGLLRDYQIGKEAKASSDASSKVAEMIAPKPTAKEARLAQSQGRLVPGKEPLMFKAGTPDTITPSQKTLSATETVTKNIPGASKMKPAELYTAVDKNITDTATKLRPQMEATPIEPKTIEKINSDWETLKKQQISDAPATEETNVAKRQEKFESLLKKSGSENHGDLWDTRIKYDDSIPENVKKANINSPESLQMQKEEWLQNRKILNDAFDSTSKPEFKQMSDMYEAKNGLLSKAKVNDALPSKFNQWIKDNPKKATAVMTALGLEGAQLLGLDIKRLIP